MEIADPQRSALLEQLVGELSALPGIAAIVLGGSYAEGAQTAASDMDIGLYYRAEDPFRVRAVREVAERMAVQPPTVTGYYAWGPWVNGGAWIQTAAGKVDFLYRNIDQVEQTIDEAQAGIVRHDFSQQPTFGFYSLIYLAETQICVPLYDPQHVVAHLKSRVAEYPPELKQRRRGRLAVGRGVYPAARRHLCGQGRCVQHGGLPHALRHQPGAGAVRAQRNLFPDR